MSLENVAEGYYKGRILDYGVVSAKEGKLPQLSIKLEFEANGNAENITWYGHLTPKAKPFTLETLGRLGMVNASAIETFGMGIASAIINHEKEVSFKINLNIWEGKTTRKVGWLGHNEGSNYMEEADSLNALKGLNLVGDAMAAIAKVNGGKLPEAKPVANGAIITSEDVGF